MNDGTKRIAGRQLQRRRAIALVTLGNLCAICGTAVRVDVHWRDGDSYQLDHRVPLARGGTDDPTNWQVVHRRCNLSKGVKLPDTPNGIPTPVVFTGETANTLTGGTYHKATNGNWYHKAGCGCTQPGSHGHSRPW